MKTLFMAAAIFQGVLILIDEYYFHLKRGLPQWERLGHPIDSASFALPLGIAAFAARSPATDLAFVVCAIASCLCITKDEWIHRDHAGATESWLHAVLFMLHPVILIATYSIWDERPWYLVVFFWLVLGFGMQQALFWNYLWPKLKSRS